MLDIFYDSLFSTILQIDKFENSTMLKEESAGQRISYWSESLGCDQFGANGSKWSKYTLEMLLTCSECTHNMHRTHPWHHKICLQDNFGSDLGVQVRSEYFSLGYFWLFRIFFLWDLFDFSEYFFFEIFLKIQKFGYYRVRNRGC